MIMIAAVITLSVNSVLEMCLTRYSFQICVVLLLCLNQLNRSVIRFQVLKPVLQLQGSQISATKIAITENRRTEIMTKI